MCGIRGSLCDGLLIHQIRARDSEDESAWQLRHDVTSKIVIVLPFEQKSSPSFCLSSILNENEQCLQDFTTVVHSGDVDPCSLVDGLKPELGVEQVVDWSSWAGSSCSLEKSSGCWFARGDWPLTIPTSPMPVIKEIGIVTQKYDWADTEGDWSFHFDNSTRHR